MVTAALLDPVAPLPSRERSMCFLFVSVPSTLTGMSVGRTFRAGCCMSDQCPRTDWQKILSPFKISTSIIRFLLQDKGWFPVPHPYHCLLYLGPLQHALS